MTFNNNLSGMGRRAKTGGGGGGGRRGGSNLGGGRNYRNNRRGGGGILSMLLMSRIGRRFGIPGILVVGAIMFFVNGGLGMFSQSNDAA